jgi:hypothetical protein
VTGSDTFPSPGLIRNSEAIKRLVRLYEATNEIDEAAEWRNDLEVAKTEME